MVQPKLKLTGGPEIEAALRELGGQIAGRLGTNAVRAGARVIANHAKALAPVGATGDLKESIRMFDEGYKGRAQRTTRTAYAGTRLFYAYWVEYGTAHSAAQPFMRPAGDTAGGEARAKMAENLSTGIKREMAKYRGRVTK